MRDFRLRLRLGLRALLEGERGMALPTAMLATVAAVALGGAAVMSTVSAQSGTKRDSASKRAIAAADAGVRVAIMRLNLHQDELGGATVCVGPEGEPQIPSGGWCPPTAPERVGDGTFTYRFAAVGSGECDGFELCAVATGTAGEVTRRVLVNFDDDGVPRPPQDDPGSEEPGEEEPPGSEEGGDLTDGVVTEGLIGEDWITMSGNADVQVGVGTNGDLTTSGNAGICGDIRVGVGKRWIRSGNVSQCKGYELVEGNRVLPPVSSFIPPDIAVSNSNYRLVKCKSADNPPGCQSDTYAGGNWTGNKPFDPASRVIQASGNTTLTLGGGDYWICGISLSGNSQLIMAAGAHVRVFFDTPEKCGISHQINLSGNNRIAATGYQPDKGQFDMPGFFLLGSPTTPTSVTISGNYSTVDEFVIYAPNTHINLSGNATLKGLVAGKTLQVSGNGEIVNDAGFRLSPDLNPWHQAGDDGGSGDGGSGDDGGGEGPSGVTYYLPQGYVECSGLPGPGEAPNAGC